MNASTSFDYTLYPLILLLKVTGWQYLYAYFNKYSLTVLVHYHLNQTQYLFSDDKSNYFNLGFLLRLPQTQRTMSAFLIVYCRLLVSGSCRLDASQRIFREAASNFTCTRCWISPIVWNSDKLKYNCTRTHEHTHMRKYIYIHTHVHDKATEICSEKCIARLFRCCMNIPEHIVRNISVNNWLCLYI